MLIGVVKCCYVPSIAVALPMITQYTTKKNSDMFVGCGVPVTLFCCCCVCFVWSTNKKISVIVFQLYN